MAGEGGVHTDLMRAPGRNVDFHERRQSPEKLHRLEHAHRILAGGRDADVAFPVLSVVGRQRRVDALGAQLPTARHQAQIGLVHSAVAY